MNPRLLLTHFDRVSEAPDAIRRLRQLTLELAIRGKLVAQGSQDEPASELLKRIQKEKARLMEAGEIRKLKSLPLIEEGTAPFDIPSGWEWVRIRQVTSDRGQVIPEQNFTYIDVTSVDKEIGRIADTRIVSAFDAPSRARKVVKTGDVLYSCVRPYLLNIAVVERDMVPPPIASTAFAVLNGFGLVLPKYLWIVLRSPFMISCVEVKMRGQAYPAINDSDFALLPLPLPPLPEQHRIVAKADELMGLCDRLEEAHAERERRRDRLTAASLNRLNHSADLGASTFRDYTRFHIRHLSRLTTRPEQIPQLRRAILNLAARGKLVPQDPRDEPASALLKRVMKDRRENWSGRGSYKEPALLERSEHADLPASWELAKLEVLTTKISDGEHFRPKVTESGVPFLSAKDVRENGVIFDDVLYVSSEDSTRFRQRCDPELGDILVISRGATVGRCCMIQTPRVFCLLGSVILLKLSDFISKPFVLWMLKSPDTLQRLIQLSGSTAQQAIYLRDIKNLPIAVPPVAEQHRIVTKIEELLVLCDQLEVQLTTARTESSRLLEAVIHQALSSAAALIPPY